MPNHRRWFVPGGTYFFTANLLDRKSWLLTDRIADLRASYRESSQRQPFDTIAICILSNHLHCIWTLLENDSDLSGRWRRLKSGFSRRLPRTAGFAPGRRPGEHGIWQGAVGSMSSSTRTISRRISTTSTTTPSRTDLSMTRTIGRIHRGTGGNGPLALCRRDKWCICGGASMHPTGLWTGRRTGGLMLSSFGVKIRIAHNAGDDPGERMSKVCIRLVLVCFGLLATAPPLHAMNAADPVAGKANVIRNRFVAAIRNCGAIPSFVPNVVVRTEPTMVSYKFGDRSIYLPRWSELPPPMQEMMAAWAAQGTMGLNPQGMFEEVFDDFLVAHELGHYLEHMSGRMEALDRADSETEANQIALAFWSLDSGDAARLPQRFDNLTRFLYGLPNPVPTGEEPLAYFAKDYWKIAADGAAYSWYQGMFLRSAWAKRNDRTFCDWVQLNPPLPISKVSAD